MGGERGRQGCNVSFHVAGAVSSSEGRVSKITETEVLLVELTKDGTATRKYRLGLSAMLGVVSVEQ